MTQVHQLYRCNICGNIVKIAQAGPGQLVCCQQPMELLIPQTEEIHQDKHLPVISLTDQGIKVTIGQELHPMEAGHYIQWIEYLNGSISYWQELTPDQAPEALFIRAQPGGEARCYCNLHSYWVNS